ncbi:hypothetical protein ABZ639_02070 [Saccharomonospora sp. NPDC006951]
MAMHSSLPKFAANPYLACQAGELLAATRNTDSGHAVQVLRHVFAEAGTAAGLWLANWYFDTITLGSDDPRMHGIVDDCIRELESAYGVA